MSIRIITLSIIILLAGCTSGYKSVPLPMAQAKLVVQPSTYTEFNSESCKAFSFEVAEEVVATKAENGRVCDLNLTYPSHNATLHLSYVNTVPDSIHLWKELARDMVYDHVDKSSGIEENSFVNEHGLNGIIYHIDGNAATNVQFAITDDSTKLMRGVLYFFATPNYDSIKPVLNKIEKDTEHLLETFKFND